MPDGLGRTPRELRDEVEQLVRDDLVGPLGGEREELDTATPPTDRYLLGLLAPRLEPRAPSSPDATWPAPTEDDEADGNAAADAQPEDELASGGITADTDAEGRPEERPAAIDQLVASAFGLTVAVAEGCDALRVGAAWGAYERTTSEERLDKDGNAARVWRRRPCGGETVVPLGRGGRIAPMPLDLEAPDVQLEGLVRERDGGHLVSLFLVNGQEAAGGRSVEKWLCQAELRVEAADGGAAFVRRSVDVAALTPAVDRQELSGLELLYRDTVELAVGHGVATEVELSPERPDRGLRVRTTALPAADVPRTDAPGLDDFTDDPPVATPFAAVGEALDMARLGTAGDSDLPRLLLPLVDAYEAWIDGQERRIGDPAARLDGHEGTARDHPNTARDRRADACRRRRTGDAVRGRGVPLRQPRDAPAAGAHHRRRAAPARPAARDRRRGGRGRRAEAPLLAPVPARLRAAQPAVAGRPDPSRTGSGRGRAGRPALLPHRRREDRGVPRARGVHAGHPSPGRCGRGPRRARRRGSAHALHAAAADPPAVPARGRAALRV